MDFILVSTENDDDAYFPSAHDLTDAILQHAIEKLGQYRDFEYLPAASLTAMSPPSADTSGATIGTLTVFRGGRVQWSAQGMDALAQDWRIPHIYSDAIGALRLWRSLRAGQSDLIAREAWTVTQVKFCPICGFDLSGLSWADVSHPNHSHSGDNHVPPLEVPPYQTCGGCGTTFGVDWIGATYGQMRQWWLDKTCPWWASGTIPEDVAASPRALEAFERLSRDLMRTPTDLPLSSAPARV